MAKTVTIYGIKTSDTMERARAWLDRQGVPYAFHDYRSAGITPSKLGGWARKVRWEVLLNRACTTFRKLADADADRDGLDEVRALALMIARPSMIKRPVLEVDGALLVGFRPDAYEAALKG